MIVFKIYLKKFKNYLSKFSKHYWINIFLIKLMFKLKNKFFNTNNVSNNKEEILIMIIMQKKMLKRMR